MKKITEEPQRITIYKINPNEQELNGEVNFDRNVDGRNLYGILNIIDSNLIITNEENDVIGVFSLNHFYFLLVNN